MNSLRDNNLSIIIGADILPTASNSDLFSQGNIQKLIGNRLWEIMEKADFRVFNLEGPLIDEKHPILKDGPVLQASEAAITGLAAMKIDLFVLANNHIRDHGALGIQRTIELAENNGIACVGIGVNNEERSQVYYFRKNGVCIGFYNCCESEESVVSEREYGANPYDPLNSFDDVHNAKEKCDFLIVLYHGGKELFRYPSPMLKCRFRKFAEKGADIVIAQHTHCIGCYEEYKGSLLLYGQGNFIFDRRDDEYFNSGLLVKIRFGINKEKKYQYESIPVKKQRNVVRIADKDEAKAILDSMKERSLKLQDEDFIRKEYERKADEYILNYLKKFHGYSLTGKILQKLFRKTYDRYLMRYLYTPKVVTHIRNYISCEAHRELLLAGLKRIVREGVNKDEQY